MPENSSLSWVKIDRLEFCIRSTDALCDWQEIKVVSIHFLRKYCNPTVFRREKMNDYLCRQYVVEEILQSISDGPATSESRSIQPEDDHEKNKMSAILSDPGSAAYNAWLTKCVSVYSKKLIYFKRISSKRCKTGGRQVKTAVNIFRWTLRNKSNK